MIITWYGHACFKIQSGDLVIVTDPFASDMVGLKFPKHTAADIVTVSHEHEDHSAVSQLEGSPFVVSGPGEYEIKEVSIVGLPTFHDAQGGSARGTSACSSFNAREYTEISPSVYAVRDRGDLERYAKVPQKTGTAYG